MFRFSLSIAFLMAVSVKGDGVMYLGLNGPATPTTFMGIPMAAVPDIDPRGRIPVNDATDAGQIQFSTPLLHMNNGIGNQFPNWPIGSNLYHTFFFGEAPGGAGGSGPSSVVMTPPLGTTAFIFNVHTDAFGQETVTVTYEDGSSVSTAFSYFDGRQTFAAYRSNSAGNPVSVTVDCPSSIFAVGLFSLGTADINPGTLPDPHFKTFANEWYDFHGACDLVLMNVPNFGMGVGLTVHIRTVIQKAYSYIQTAAIKIGDDIMQVAGHGDYVLNSVESAVLPYRMAGRYPVRQNIVNSENEELIFDLGEGRNFTMHMYKAKGMVSFSFHLPGKDEEYEGTVGLLGHYKTGARLARDGKTTILNPVRFGQEWQVRDDEPMLFETIQAPQYPDKCVMPDPVARENRRLRGTVSDEAAAEACAHIKNKEERDMCIFDVTSTEDINLAQSGVY